MTLPTRTYFVCYSSGFLRIPHWPTNPNAAKRCLAQWRHGQTSENADVCSWHLDTSGLSKCSTLKPTNQDNKCAPRVHIGFRRARCASTRRPSLLPKMAGCHGVPQRTYRPAVAAFLIVTRRHRLAKVFIQRRAALQKPLPAGMRGAHSEPLISQTPQRQSFLARVRLGTAVWEQLRLQNLPLRVDGEREG